MRARAMTSKAVVDPDWIGGAEARRILGWESTDSVRVSARQHGRFRWRKKSNGRIEYHRGDVEEYRDRRAQSNQTEE